MTAYGGPPRPAPVPEPDRTTCGNCNGTGYVKQNLWQNGAITDQHNTERCPYCGGTGEIGRSRRVSAWDEWKEKHEQSQS